MVRGLGRPARKVAGVHGGGEVRQQHPGACGGRARRPDPGGALVTRVALVTGAGRGIGRASAIALAGAGFTVVLAGRSTAELEESAAEAGGGAVALTCDVRDPAPVAALFAKVDARFARLHLLFNNAGVCAPPLPLEVITLSPWTAPVDADLTS